MNPRSAPKRLPRRFRWLTLVGALLLLAAVVVSWQSWQVYTAAQSVQQEVSELRALASGPLNGDTLEPFSAQLRETRAAVGTLREEAAPFLPVLRRLGWLPEYGADAVAVAPLLDVAEQASSALDESAPVLVPLLTEVNSTATLTEAVRLAEELAAARPRLEEARAAAIRAEEAWATVPVAQLDPRVQEQVAQVGPLLPLLTAGLDMALAGEAVVTPLLPLAQKVGNPHDLQDRIHEIQPDLAATRATLEQARPQIAQAASSWADVPQADLPPTIQQRAPQIAAVPVLLNAAVDLTVAADDTLTALAPVLPEAEAARFDRAKALARLDQARPQFETARESIAQATDTWATLPREHMPAALRERLRPLDELLPLASGGIELALVLPHMLGLHEPQEYILIAQTPDELRPTGGFISAVGQFTAQDGNILNIDVNHTDNILPRPELSRYPSPPEPFQRYMDIYYWVFRDGNWSPDFPESAQTLQYLYELERGEPPEHIIAITPTALQYLLSATGPVMVTDTVIADTNELVSAENLPQYIIDSYNAHFLAPGVHRKAFLGPLMESIMQRLQTGAGDLDLLALTRAGLRMLDEKHALVYTEHTPTAEMLARNGWDGAVRPGEHDFLMVVDANVGYTKANYYVEQAITYTVDLRDPAAPTAEVRIRHTHTAPVAEPCTHWRDTPRRPDGVLPYADHTEKCYWDYMRVLVPIESELRAVQSEPVPAAWGLSNLDDGSAQLISVEWVADVISTFLIVPTGGSRETVLGYSLPPNVVAQTGEGWRYQLRLQKQAGREAIPATVRVLLPEGAPVRTTSPVPTATEGQLLTWNLDLATDRTLTIDFGAHGAAAQQPQGSTP
jgi:hypothetical protein